MAIESKTEVGMETEKKHSGQVALDLVKEIAAWIGDKIGRILIAIGIVIALGIVFVCWSKGVVDDDDGVVVEDSFKEEANK